VALLSQCINCMALMFALSHDRWPLSSTTQQAREFKKKLILRRDCLLPIPPDKDLIARLRVPQKFPVLAPCTKKFPITDKITSVSCVISN